MNSASPDASPDASGDAALDAGFDTGVPEAVADAPGAMDTGVGIDASAEAAVADAPGAMDAWVGIDASAEAAVSTPAPDYAWYVLDETSGTTAHDSTANHFDVLNIAGVTWGMGASFDGTGGGGFTNVDQRFRTPPLTMTAWLRPSARTDGTLSVGALQPYPPNVLCGDVPYVGGYGLGLNVWTDGAGGSALCAEEVDTCTQMGLCVCNQNVGNAPPPCTTPQSCNAGFVAGTEYFVAVAIGPAIIAGSRSEARVYVDGELWDVTTANVPPAAIPAPLALAVTNTDVTFQTHRFYAGRMRDVRVYTRAVGAAEIAQLYADGPTTQAPPAGDP